MFEFDQYRAIESRTDELPKENITFARGIKKRSFLLWSEHCIECAAPQCYQTCDLYVARPDLRCRRFEAGMRRNSHFHGQTGGAAEIVFAKWGKLEARGNTFLLPNGVVNSVEIVAPALQKLINAFGRLVYRFGGSPPWNSLSFELLDYLAKRLQNLSVRKNKPYGFLIEIYNPQDHVCNVKFSCAVSRSNRLSITTAGKLALPYWKQLELKPGYNRLLIPYDELSQVVESGLPYNISFTPNAESGTRLVFVTCDFVTVDALKTNLSVPLNSGDKKPDAKCVVFDLDNTLWDGVLLEGTVTLKSIVPALFEALDERGILISIVSKNNEQEALKHLQVLGLDKYLVYPAINWKLKSENIKWLAEKLSIGTDTLIFIDDSPFEREEVANFVSDIEVLPETALEGLLKLPRLQGGSTVESANRRLMYQQQAQRSTAAMEFGDDYLAFLKSSEIVVTIGAAKEDQHDRIVELLQRTNQLNFSGMKYSRAAVNELLLSSYYDKHVIRCSDKYGDYGIVGFAITSVEPEKATIKVRDFMLSCRVQGKLIEKAFFSYLASQYADDTVAIDVNFLATERNGLAKSVLQEIGFSMQTDNTAVMIVQSGQLDVDFLEIRTDASNVRKTADVAE